MQEISVKLDTITPVFLGGADPRHSVPELRAPAFRGAMRYWLRATIGGVIGDENLDGLRKLETAVFGSPDAGSPISVSVTGALSSALYSILPHKTGGGKRDGFEPSQQFELCLRGRAGIDTVVWVNACMALNLALLFGGVGLRSRRGFGGLRVVQSSDIKLIPRSPSTQEKWPRHVERIAESAIEWARQLAQKFSVPVVGLPGAPTEYPCAAQGAVVRIATIASPSANDILIDMMRAMPQVSYLGGIRPRQSSPLWIRVFWADDDYHLLLCLLPSRLAGGTQDYARVREFMDRSFPGTDLQLKGWNL